MNKKQLVAFVENMVAEIVARANALPGGEEPLTEAEARTLLGVQLKKAREGLLDAVLPKPEPVAPEAPATV